MEEIRKYSVVFEICYDIFPQTKSTTIFSYPRIPHIIETSKDYSSFVVNIANPPERIILLKDSHLKGTLTLNYNYFTPEEIFKTFSIPYLSSFQTIGHITHLNLEHVHEPYKYIIGNVYLDKLKNIKTVISKKTSIRTQFRVFDYEILAGEDNLKTIHLENKIRYFIDYGRVYWNGKLEKERKLLAHSLTGLVCDPFCGVGPLVLNCLKLGCDVICNDLNPVAIECLNKTIKLNSKGLKGKCEIYNLDAAIFLETVVKNDNLSVDSFVFNLPELSLKYISALCNYNRNFRLVAYFFARTEEDALCSARDNSFFAIDRVNYVRSVSPSKKMYKIDQLVINIKDS